MTGDLEVRFIRRCIEVPRSITGDPAVLVMDSHGSHFTLDLLTYCRHSGLHGLLRPPHTTHILQREDLVLSAFQHVQRSVSSVSQRCCTLESCCSQGRRKYRLGEGDLVDVAHEAWRIALSQETACRR